MDRSQPLGPRASTAQGAVREIGPLEWDLAFLPDEVSEVFPEAGGELLAILRTLNSAVVATWCFARHEFADMRRHGEHHLQLLRDAHGTDP